MFSKAVELAAAETLGRIRSDKEGQPRVLRRLLAYIEDSLFRKELTVGHLSGTCQVSATTIRRLFRERLHCTPWSYIRDRRMEVAEQLFSSSNLSIWQIAEAVGYSTTITFSKMFSEWSGISPEHYLQAAQNRENRANPCDWAFWRTLNGGEAAYNEAEWAVHHLEQLYGLSPKPPAHELPDPEFDDEVMAEVLWSRLRNIPFEEQKKALVQQYGFRTPALFDMLLTKSREEMRSEPRKAVQMLELALSSVAATAWAMRADFPDHRARGYAWLGNARRRALDFPGAEAAFEQAEEAWNVPRPKKDQLALAEICHFKAGLRADQRRFAEALKLANQGVKIFRAEGSPEQLAEAVMARAIIIAYSGHPQDSIREFEEAMEIIEQHQPVYSILNLSALANLVTGYAVAERFEEAEQLLPKAQAIAAATADRTVALHLRWVEGLVAQGKNDTRLAEDCFLEAMRGFTAIDESGYAAVTALELAVLYAEQGRISEAVDQAAGSIPIFEAFKIRREAIAALDLIREAVAGSSLPVSTAKDIRGYLMALRKDPLFTRLRARQKDEPSA